MKNLKPLLSAIAVASAMNFTSAASATPYSYGGSSHSYGGGSFSTGSNTGYSNSNFSSNHYNNRKRILGASDTASFYYRVGLKHYNNGNLDKAEKAFVSALLADGLDKQALFYLVHISEKQGDKFKMEKYVKSFHETK